MIFFRMKKEIQTISNMTIICSFSGNVVTENGRMIEHVSITFTEKETFYDLGCEGELKSQYPYILHTPMQTIHSFMNKNKNRYKYIPQWKVAK